ncbi:hypothetical protein VTK73DRAFT_9468 [Phialemonium thermophilum]|uniref:Uncharacterized protein n=1 Tax=Phialemonium thermophilum TaxID=223376 RepID=A0ABR3W1V1_9PEZI
MTRYIPLNNTIHFSCGPTLSVLTLAPLSRHSTAPALVRDRGRRAGEAGSPVDRRRRLPGLAAPRQRALPPGRRGQEHGELDAPGRRRRRRAARAQRLGQPDARAGPPGVREAVERLQLQGQDLPGVHGPRRSIARRQSRGCRLGLLILSVSAAPSRRLRGFFIFFYFFYWPLRYSRVCLSV